LLDDSGRKSGAVLLTIEQFEEIARILEGEILAGRAMPKSEPEITSLIHALALKPHESLGG